MRTSIYILLLAAASIIATASFAQNRHELSITGGAGISSFSYKTSFGSPSYRFGGFAGMGYTYFFSPSWGVGTGIEASWHSAKINLGAFNTAEYNLMDDEGDKFDFHSNVSNYKELQQALFLSIPLRLMYQTSGNTKFYASGGVKFGLPVYANYQGSNATFINKGYYFEIDNWFTTQRFRGFGTFTGINADDKLNLKPAFMATAEAGVKWPLKNSSALYTGIYFDYGLNDVIKDSRDRSFTKYNYESPAEFTSTSVLTSSHADNGKLIAFTEKVVPFAVGVKVAFVFGRGKPSVAKPLTPTPDTKPEGTSTKEKEPEVIVGQSEKERKEEQEKVRQEQEEARRQAQEAERQQQAKEQQKQEEKRSDEKILLEPITDFPLRVVLLSDEQKRELDKRIALLQKHPQWYIICEGHTCDIGSESNNIKIGFQRAEMVKEYMTKNGLDGSKIGIMSKGEANPMLPNTSEENRLKNRRVEFIIKQ